MYAAWTMARTTSEVSRATLQPGAPRAFIFSRWRTLSVRILTDANIGSGLRSLLRRHRRL